MQAVQQNKGNIQRQGKHLHLFGRRRLAPRTLWRPALRRSLLRLTLRRLPLQLTLPLQLIRRHSVKGMD